MGSLKETWLKQVWHLAKGKSVETLPTDEDNDALPPITIVYPTQRRQLHAGGSLCCIEHRLPLQVQETVYRHQGALPQLLG